VKAAEPVSTDDRDFGVEGIGAVRAVAVSTMRMPSVLNTSSNEA
jgi:hypothetical protein